MESGSNIEKKNSFLKNLQKKLEGKELGGDDNIKASEFIEKIQQVHKQAGKYDGKSEEEMQEIIDKRIEESGGKIQEEVGEEEREVMDEQFEESMEEVKEEDKIFKAMAVLQNAETDYAKLKIELNKKKCEIVQLRKEYDEKYGIDS